MKKNLLIGLFFCMSVTHAHAQVYGNDRIVSMPVRETYDRGLMDSYLNAMAATAARRQELYEFYSDKAFEAFDKNQWSLVIYNVGEALNTKYYSGSLYFIRGYAYEQLMNYRAAKRDYKKAKKYNSIEAAQALEILKMKMKRKK